MGWVSEVSQAWHTHRVPALFRCAGDGISHPRHFFIILFLKPRFVTVFFVCLAGGLVLQKGIGFHGLGSIHGTRMHETYHGRFGITVVHWDRVLFSFFFPSSFLSPHGLFLVLWLCFVWFLPFSDSERRLSDSAIPPLF